MILFCDTSALVKLYVREDFTEDILALANSATAIAVCRIAWAETMAALARRARNTFRHRGIEAVRKRLRDAWPRYAIVEVTQPLVELAGEFADTFALRGYDRKRSRRKRGRVLNSDRRYDTPPLGSTIGFVGWRSPQRPLG